MRNLTQRVSLIHKLRELTAHEKFHDGASDHFRINQVMGHERIKSPAHGGELVFNGLLHFH
ncbi:hypothetical protein Hpkin79_01800 [Helicobacter pylori]